MNENLKKSLLKSQIFFYSSLVVFVTVGYLAIKGVIPQHSLFGEKVEMYLQTICLLLFFVCIPACLFWFRKKTTQLLTLEEAEERIRRYQKMVNLRIICLDFMCLLSIGLTIFTHMENAKMFFYMIIIFYLFIVPGKGQLLRDLALNEDGSIVVAQEAPNASFQENASNDEDDFIPKNQASDNDDDDFIPKNR